MKKRAVKKGSSPGKKKTPLKIPTRKCLVCRHKNKVRVQWINPWSLTHCWTPTPWSQSHKWTERHPGGFEQFCPVCDHKYDGLLEEVSP